MSYHGILALWPLAFFLPRLWRDGRLIVAVVATALYVLALSPVVFWWPEAYLRFACLLALTAILMATLAPIALPRWAFVASLVSVSIFALAGRGSAPQSPDKDDATPVAGQAARSESPALAPYGLVFSAIDRERYVLTGDISAGVPKTGNFFSPAFARNGQSLFFEIADGGRSRIVELREGAIRNWTPDSMSCGEPSPDAEGVRVAAACEGDVFLFRWDARIRNPFQPETDRHGLG